MLVPHTLFKDISVLKLLALVGFGYVERYIVSAYIILTKHAGTSFDIVTGVMKQNSSRHVLLIGVQTMRVKVVLSKRATKDLFNVPPHIVVKLQSWVNLVETSGMHIARLIPGFHDEPLYAPRTHQRSIRLSKSYRAFYIIEKLNDVENVIVLEVNKHGY
jgi:proteic killer suppression protein